MGKNERQITSFDTISNKLEITQDKREGGKKTSDETDIDIWELFVGYRFILGGNERVVIRLGRQLIETANLFINVGEGNNVRQSYDGLRVGWIDDDFIKFDLFLCFQDLNS